MINELKMDELKDLFFYAFGIVPLQAYGAIGDGYTDNRLQIQQAIYDAINVGAKYIYVPKGNYFYTQQLFRANEVIFVGNSVDAYIRGINIRQFPDLWNEAQATTGAITPVGGIIITASVEIPEYYLECNGQTVNTEAYTSLYESITSNLPDDPGDYPETFTLPNLSTGVSGTKYIIRAK
jgi:hypothetical protein